MDDLYHQEILDHYHHPDNFGALKNPDHTIEESNASCGDSFTFYLKIKPSKTLPLTKGELEGVMLQDLKFTGTGCAISTAACSLLATHLKGKPLKEVENLTLDFMQTLIGSQITPMRLKCLMLPAKAMQKLINPTKNAPR
jgi:nitrogen fixation protein NifU and related proteins